MLILLRNCIFIRDSEVENIESGQTEINKILCYFYDKSED